MSSLPNNAEQLVSPANESSDRESFHKFFECWLAEQNQILPDLVSAVDACENNRRSTVNGTADESARDDDERILRPLINRVLQHYEQYYRAKSRWEEKDVLGILSPSWRSSLEEAFLWIGGWRPSMAFHLLYSKVGLQFEAQLTELVQGLTTRDLGDLSAHQLTQVDDLQRETIKKEKEITEKMAKHQESIADKSMVGLSHIVTESIRNGEINEGNNRTADEHVQVVLDSKEEGLAEITHEADDLRLRTLKGITNILNPTQAVHFLIAAAELHVRLHEWGKRRDADRNRRLNR